MMRIRDNNMSKFFWVYLLFLLTVVNGSEGLDDEVSPPNLKIDEDVQLPLDDNEVGGDYLGNSQASEDILEEIQNLEQGIAVDAHTAVASENENDVTDSLNGTLWNTGTFSNETASLTELNNFLESEDELITKTPPSIIIGDKIEHPFQENLHITPLSNNYILTSFEFSMNSSAFTPGKSLMEYDIYSHYTVFPKAFSSILEQTSTRELHIRFTRGFWDAEDWGRLPNDGSKSGGSGVELWSVIEADTKENAYKQWKILANSLSGLFCASMNFIDSSKTTYPVSSFQPNDALPLFDSNKELYLVRAALANEPICTENLTPFVRLLPTKGKSGISTLLDGHKVFDSSWHNLAIDVITECDDMSGTCFYSMEALVDVVMNVPNVLARSDRPIPRPLQGDDLRCDPNKPHDEFQCFPLPEDTQTSYAISKLFGKKIHGSNLISSNPSTVCVDATDNWNILIENSGNYFTTGDNCFELDGSSDYDIHMESNDTRSVVKSADVPVYVSRSLTGYGQDRGGLRTVFSNKDSSPVTLVYFETLPWFMRLYLSSMKLETKNAEHSELTLDNLIESINYQPAVDRIRPTHLEYTITIPANSSIALSIQFDKSLLKYAEYPPDANHGFEIESAVITVVSPVQYQMRTSTLLLLLATPDFSMPYNVIILTSTTMGLIFGTLFNMLVKRLVTLEEADKVQAISGPKYKLLQLKQRILAKIGM